MEKKVQKIKKIMERSFAMLLALALVFTVTVSAGDEGSEPE